MISIIVPVGGGRPERRKRLETYLGLTLYYQDYEDFEVIVVEQSLDGKYYYEDLGVDTYIPIQDPLGRGFNESFCYNVAARYAKGDILALLGMDFVFGSGLLADASKIDNFAFACTTCDFASQDQTDLFYKNFDIPLLLNSQGYASFTPRKGAAVGICFVRKNLYFQKYGGWIEDFFGWGLHDKQFARQVAEAELTPVTQLPMLPHKITHLCHDKERHLDLVNVNSEEIFNKLSKFSVGEIVKLNDKCGTINKPHIILEK